MQTLSQGMRGFILNTDAGKIRHILGTPALFDRFKSTFSRAPSASGHYVDMVESSLQNINKSMAVSIESKAEGKGFNWIWDKIKLAV